MSNFREEAEELLQKLDLAYTLHFQGNSEVKVDINSNIDQTLAALEALHKREVQQHRYCGICYRPCINVGGWKCPEHSYDSSVLITSAEASELRAEQRAKLNTEEK